MTSEPIRDPVTDHLLTPQNSALIVVDYQPSQVQTVQSMELQRDWARVETVPEVVNIVLTSRLLKGV
jgi:nicotinamidase-related amidase